MIHPIDIIIGSNVRKRRIAMNVTQEELADKLAISSNQMRKNEHGRNKITSTRLHEIAVILDCNATDFFSGIDKREGEIFLDPDLTKREIEIIRNWRATPADIRAIVNQMVSTLAKHFTEGKAHGENTD